MIRKEIIVISKYNDKFENIKNSLKSKTSKAKDSVTGVNLSPVLAFLSQEKLLDYAET
jgi:hypothetical protein